MIILVLNSGSSSLKYQLHNQETDQLLATGLVERIAIGGSIFSHKTQNHTEKGEHPFADHAQAIDYVLKLLTHKDFGVLTSLDEINAVGHRIVHGGETYVGSVLIDEEVIANLEKISYLAPLHNPANIIGINAIRTLLPALPNVAVFDTAFHQTLPEHAYMYALPLSYYRDYGVRRYGFHGTSHLYVAKRAAKLMGKPVGGSNIITMHIGNGASACAIRNGVSVDTSMGLSPLEGLVMGTRSGDIDATVVQLLSQQLGKNSDEVLNILNKESGVLGISEQYSDRRDIEGNLDDPRCALAFDMETYRIKKYVGSYMAVLGRVDAIVFTAGVGENSGPLREKALAGLEGLGIVLDTEKNSGTLGKHGETLISAPESKVKVYVIPTNEELVIIEDTVSVVRGTYKNHMDSDYSFE